MPKLGATIKVASIIITIKLSLIEMLSSFAVIEAIGPEAFATLFAPIEKATYNDIKRINPFKNGFIFIFCDRDISVYPLLRMGL